MGKNQKAAQLSDLAETPGNPTDGSKKRGYPSFVSQLTPYLPKLIGWAEDDYKKLRFDTAATDEEVRSADKLRQVLANFGSR
jgi:hypothetical protein